MFSLQYRRNARKANAKNAPAFSASPSMASSQSSAFMTATRRAIKMCEQARLSDETIVPISITEFSSFRLIRSRTSSLVVLRAF